MMPPNKRVKLMGGDRCKGSECCALAGQGLRPTTLRPRASRPHLKRDPLGSTPTPRVNQAVSETETSR